MSSTLSLKDDKLDFKKQLPLILINERIIICQTSSISIISPSEHRKSTLMSKPSCKIWDLEHIWCYQKSTLPLSEEYALAMQPVEASPYSITSPSPLLMSNILSTNFCANVASVLLLTLPLPTLHMYCNYLSFPVTVTEKSLVFAIQTNSLPYPSTL